jgi:Trk K+ transport system NAD-binding subunit
MRSAGPEPVRKRDHHPTDLPTSSAGTEPSSCEDWTGHVIVCGLEGVGLRTVEQLHQAGVRVVVIADGPEVAPARVIRSWGVPHLVGSARVPETLMAAGLDGAAAVVCVEADDLLTLEAALLARELRPELRVIAALRNPAVGRALVGIAVSVLDAARLAAPSVVEACLHTGAHDLDLGGEHFVAASVIAGPGGTLRALYGDLAPVAVAPASGGPVAICPGRDHVVAPDDTVTVVGTPEQLRAAGLTWGRASDGSRARGRTSGRLRHLIASVAHATDRRLPLALGGLLALLVVATTVLRMGYREPTGARMTLLDAIYFTVETIATIGYGDFSFRDQPSWLRVFAIMLMAIGAMLATVFFALLTNLIVTRRIEESLGRRRLIGRSGHVVVIGLGSIGLQVTERLLAQGADVVVVDTKDDNKYLAQVRAAKVPVVIADATLPQTLKMVNIDDAAAIAILTSDDLVNIETGLAVRDQLGERWRQIPVVLRLFDRQLARTVERNFAFGCVRSTAALAAPWFVGAALGLDVLGTFYVGDEPMLVARLTVAAQSGLNGLAMQDLSARTRVVAISRAADSGGLEHPPRRGTRFRAGDEAYLVGPYDELLQVLRRDTLSPASVLGDAVPTGEAVVDATAVDAFDGPPTR